MKSTVEVLVFASHVGNPQVSYYWDWYEAVASFPALRVNTVHTHDKLRLAWELRRRKGRSYDLILFLYGFYYANDEPVAHALFELLDRARGTRVFFLENEYRFVARKLAMATRLGADFVTSQFPQDVAEIAYRPFFPRERIVSLPHGLNERVVSEWFPRSSSWERPYDLGFRGDPYPFYIGHQDRQELGRFFTANAERYGLKVRVDEGRESRLERRQWLVSLSQCKGALHHESGPSYLETNDETRLQVIAYLRQHPEATYPEVFERFFRARPGSPSGRAIAPRHFEAIGTRTCQIMFPGRFNDILTADEHYIALERDFSNADDAVRRFKDESLRRAITERALEHVLAGHTLRHRIEQLLRAVGIA